MHRKRSEIPLYEGEHQIKVVSWEVTRKCNFSCIHCYNNSSPNFPYELPLSKCYKLIDRIKEVDSIETLIITGGEPLYRKDIEDIVKYCRPKFKKLILQTNGYFIPSKSKDFLTNFDEIVISIYGKPSTDSLFKRSYETRVLESLETLKKLGIPFSISTVLTKINKDDMQYLYEFSKNVGANMLLVQVLIPIGRGKLLEKFICDPNEYKRIKEELKRIDKEGFIKFGSEQPCGGGSYFIEIDYGGNVSPHPFYSSSENIFKKSLKEIFKSEVFLNFYKIKENKKYCPLFYGKFFV